MINVFYPMRVKHGEGQADDFFKHYNFQELLNNCQALIIKQFNANNRGGN